jgi:hypothetical protein
VTDLKISKQQGATGGAGESVDQTTTFYRKDGTYQTPGVADGVFDLNAGSNTAGSAPVLTPTFASGTASQLSDTTRDYMVYLNVTTSGTATSVTIGPTSAGSTVSIVASASVTAGQVIVFRLPAGWYVKWTGTTTVLAQAAIGC